MPEHIVKAYETPSHRKVFDVAAFLKVFDPEEAWHRFHILAVSMAQDSDAEARYILRWKDYKILF